MITGFTQLIYSGDFSINSTTLSIMTANTTRVYVAQSGLVGINTTAPGQTLHVVGNANISSTLNAPVINTTSASQNITISSASGSVIIRLGARLQVPS